MSAELKISMQEFNRAAELCVQRSERTYDKFINSRALHVAKKAIEDTEKASADKIVFELAHNVAAKSRISRKTGKRKITRTYDLSEQSLAARIVNARLVARGEKTIWGAELVRKAKRMIGGRTKAVAFIKSGWIYAVRTLGAAVGGGAGVLGATRMSGQAKGYAKPARRAINSVVTAEIANTALLSEDARSRVAVKGLAKAFDRERKEMLEHAFKTLQPVFSSVSAKP